EVQANPTALNATALTLAPNLFGAPPAIVAVNCVNGVGSGCDSQVDGLGIVHYEAVVLGTALPTPPLSGVLFTISYKVGNNGFTNIHFITSDLRNGATGNLVPHLTVDGVYGTPPAPDFTISTINSALIIPPNSRANATISLASRNQFIGKVNLTATVSPPGVSIHLNPSNVTLNNNTAKANATISTIGSLPGYHSVTITAVGTSGQHTLQIDVTVKSNPDFTTQAL